MQQGDEYKLPIQIYTRSGQVITPENCVDIKIAIKCIGIRAYSDGSLEYNAEHQCWLYDLSQEETLHLGPRNVEIQAQVLFSDGNIVTTPVKGTPIGCSIIREAWEA